MKKILRNFLWVLFFIGSQAYAQTRTVTGTVTGKDDGLPLPGVSVVVKGTKTGTQTGTDGGYSIKVPEGNHTLVFSFVGFTTQSIPVTGNRINVVLTGTASSLNEVVVVGYGTQVKRDVNGSITSIRGTEMAEQPVQNIQQSLGGRAAGVQVTMPNGLLNQNPTIRIRGTNSIALSSQPLYVIDGVPSFEGNQNGGTAAAASPLGNLNPEDIESVEIAKDASSTAIYGSRAANGVVYITTKKGKKGRTTVSIDSWIGESKPMRLPKLLDAQQFTDIKNEALTNARQLVTTGSTPVYFATMNDANGKLINTDWQDIIYRTGVGYNSTASISGGTESTNYYISSNWTKQNGILDKNSFERKGILANVDHRVNSIISIGTKLSYSNTLNKAATSSGSQEGEAFGITGLGRIGIVLAPNVSPYNADGTYNISGNALGLGANKGIGFSYYNIQPIIDLNRSNNELNQVNANAYFQVKPLPWLTLRTQYGVDYLFRNVDTFQNPFQGDGINLASATDTYYSNKRWVWDNTLQVDKVFGKHTFNFVAGNEQDRRYNRGFGINRTGLSDFGFNVIQAGYSTNATSGLSYGDYYLVSLFGRLTYDFDKKYFLSGTVRQDQYSPFGNNKKKGTFPGFSAGWEITREKFWNAIGADKVFSSFKVRGSWGRVGNASNFGAYDSYGLYSNSLYNGQATLNFTQTGNADLGWETIAKTDLGINWGIMNDRISGELALYRNDINDLIFQVPTIPSAGLPSNPPVNIGKMFNRGIEFNVSAQAVRTRDFNWTPSFNIAFNQNQLTYIIPSVTRLTNATSGSETVSINEVGHSVGSLYIVRTGGIDPQSGRRIFIDGQGRKVYYQQVVPTTGGYQWEFADGTRSNPITQSDAAVNYKNTSPKYLGGFENTFHYKNFDLNVLMTYQLGFWVYYGTNAGLHDQRFWNNATDIITDRWTTPGQTNAKYAKIIYGDNVSNGSSLPLDINVFKGDFLKLKSVNFGYSLPKNMLSKVGISNLRFYLSAYNLFIITKYPGPDPEVSSNGTNNSTQGVDRNTAGNARTLTAGFSVKF